MRILGMDIPNSSALQLRHIKVWCRTPKFQTSDPKTLTPSSTSKRQTPNSNPKC